MTLNIQVMGEVGSVRQLAESMRQLGAGVEEVATGWHRVRGAAEGVWEGPASDNFQQVADRSGKDGDEFARLHDAVAQALTVFADDVDTVKARMAQAETVAHEGELTVFPGKMIYEPEAFTMNPPGTLSGRVPAGQTTDHAQQQAEFDAAKAANGKKQAAFAEAQATVNQARQIEKAAHEKLVAALNANSSALTQVSSSGQWSKAGEHPTSPATLAIAGAATAMDDHAANATRAQFEKTLSNGPASTNACWASLSEAQRGELMSRFPRMVGSADGLPSPVRHTANMGLIGQQRQQVLAKLQDAKARLNRSLTNSKGGRDEIANREIDELNGALQGLDAVTAEAERPNRYLLSIDAPSNSRGQVVIASGNPDTAQNVSTTVPGTYADLSEAMSYVGSGDAVSERAQQMSGQSVSNITWIDYQAPEGLLNATEGRYAENASGDLSNFQEGLRASHQEGYPPSNNTVIGHSYGSTTVGYAARDHGINSDNIVFIGSPGVGVDHAQGLGVPPENVWSGTGKLDAIDYFTPSPNPFDYSDIRDDQQWFGRNPSNELFGARDLPVDTWDSHGSYWQDPKSVDGMARVVSGTAEQPPPQQQ